MTPAAEKIHHLLATRIEELDRDKLTRFQMARASEKDLEITDCRGKRIGVGLGFEFEGSLRKLFWQFIKPCIDDTVQSVCDVIELSLSDYSIELRVDSLDCVELELKKFAANIYNRMVKLDQRMRGKGYPDSVAPYDPSHEIDAANALIAKKLRILRQHYLQSGSSSTLQTDRNGDMELDDPNNRRAFRRELSRLGIEEVRYRLGAQKYSKPKAAVVSQWIADFESGAAVEDDLLNAVDELDALKAQFVKGNSATGLFLPSEHAAAFERLFLEVKTLVDQRLGDSNDYSRRLIASYNAGVGGFTGGPSLACVMETIEITRGAIKQVRRSPNNSTPASTKPPSSDPYVDLTRLSEIKSASNSKWDFGRLAQMCEELNAAYEGKNYISVAMLVRGIIDHVPPIFGKKNFTEVANNHGSKSFKDSMDHLDKSMRKIGDAYLHEQIRKKESLPSQVQVDVRRELDVLLAEAVRSV